MYTVLGFETVFHKINEENRKKLRIEISYSNLKTFSTLSSKSKNNERLTVMAIMSRQCPSTMLNLRPSSGICAMISSEPKIGSRYNQVAWTFSHSSRISWIICRRLLHSRASASKGLMYGEPNIVSALIKWSSNSSWISSTEDKILTPVSLYATRSNTIPAQSSFILPIAFSIEYSLAAQALISSSLLKGNKQTKFSRPNNNKELY